MPILKPLTVMSSFVRNLLINNGVSIHIKVCGLGLEHINLLMPKKDFNINAKKYKYLHVSSCFPRKGIDYLFLKS